MSSSYDLQFDIENIMDRLAFTEAEYIRLAEVIVKGMCERIRNDQITADGEPIDENSTSWAAFKENTNAPGRTPLWYKGGLSTPTTYEIIWDGEGFTIQLEPGYEDIHLNLIEISEQAGKNYSDWFGIHEDDIEIIMALARAILNSKLERM